MISTVQERLAEAVGLSKEGQAEALAMVSDSSLSRFANNRIHQNMSRKEIILMVRVAIGNKIGVASVNSLDSFAIRKAVERATAISRQAPAKEDFYGLAQDTAPQYDIERFSKETGDYPPEEKAKKIKKIVAIAKDMSASGYIENGLSIMGIANSKGINKVESVTSAGFNLVLTAADSSGYASATQSNINDIDFEDLTKEAYKNATASKKPQSVEPGKYTVILEPYAVAEMISMLSYSGMGALSYQENRSFLSGNLGKQILSPAITIYDDASDERMVGFGFDYEGVTRQKVVIIDKGIAKTPVYDTQTAAKEGRKSTGHGLPATSKIGPLPLNLILKGGKKDRSDLIKETEKGIYVTRFHYTNLENPVKAVLTGMTRDGTYLIENGRITKPVKNLRFTQGIVEALNNNPACSSEVRLVEALGGACLVPYLKLDGFNFTSVTEF